MKCEECCFRWSYPSDHPNCDRRFHNCHVRLGYTQMLPVTSRDDGPQLIGYDTCPHEAERQARLTEQMEEGT